MAESSKKALLKRAKKKQGKALPILPVFRLIQLGHKGYKTLSGGKKAASNAEKIVKIVSKPTKNISSTAKTSAKDLKKLLKQSGKNLPKKTTLGTLAKGVGIGTGLEMIGSEVGRKTGVDLPDLSFSQQLLAPRTANAPLNKKPKKK